MICRRIARTALTLTAGLSVALGTAAAAHAGAFRHRDATGDVLVTYQAHGIERIESRRLDPDVEQFTVTHNRWAVTVATTLRAFKTENNGWRAYLLTSKGERYQVSRGLNDAGTKVTYYFFGPGGPVKCAGVYASRTASGIIAKVPTRCLGSPWKVRVGVQASAEYVRAQSSGVDDAMRDRGFSYSAIGMSPWVAR